MMMPSPPPPPLAARLAAAAVMPGPQSLLLLPPPAAAGAEAAAAVVAGLFFLLPLPCCGSGWAWVVMGMGWGEIHSQGVGRRRSIDIMSELIARAPGRVSWMEPSDWV